MELLYYYFRQVDGEVKHPEGHLTQLVGFDKKNCQSCLDGVDLCD
jgi:hypothetical protein